MSRQYLTVAFRSGDKRTYTYHNDGDPVGAGQQVKVPDRSGEGWSRVTVVEVGVPAPTRFETKAILGLAPPLTDPDAEPDQQRKPAPLGHLFGDGQS